MKDRAQRVDALEDSFRSQAQQVVHLRWRSAIAWDYVLEMSTSDSQELAKRIRMFRGVLGEWGECWLRLEAASQTGEDLHNVAEYGHQLIQLEQLVRSRRQALFQRIWRGMGWSYC